MADRDALPGQVWTMTAEGAQWRWPTHPELPELPELPEPMELQPVLVADQWWDDPVQRWAVVGTLVIVGAVIGYALSIIGG